MIHRFLIAFILLSGPWTWPAPGQTPEAPIGSAPGDEKLVIRGNEFVVVSPEKLQARGFTVVQIPRENNAFWVYLEAINILKDVPPDLQESFDAVTKGGAWPDGEAGERLARVLVDNGQALDLARRATLKAEYNAPALLSPGAELTMSTAMLPTLTHQRQLARLFALEAASLQAKGQSDAALENYLTIERMGNHVGGSANLLIEGLVGVAINSLASQGITRLAESGAVSPDTLRNALSDFDQMTGLQPDWQRMLEAERHFGETFIDDAMDTPGGFWMMATGFIARSRQEEPNGWSELVRRLKRLYLPDRTIKKQLREHYDALAAAGKPREDGTVITIEEDSLFRKIPAWNGPVRMIVPSLSRAYELTLMSRSNFERARLSMAVAAYRADHGEPPPSLAALTPTYVGSIPPDPMTGYDFEYQVASDAAGGFKGLERVTRENEAELQKKRRAPAILSPRASRWRRYAQSVCDRYQFTGSQRTAAEAILRDMESRAGQYEQTQGVKLMELVEAGQSEELARKVGPLDQMFNELKQRLDTLPDAKQRAAASQPATSPEKGPGAKATGS
jgi:hypothetical protein